MTCLEKDPAATRRPVIIYSASNLVEQWRGRLYIGVTEKTLSGRRHNHHYAAAHGSQTRFHRALRKYGRDAFLWQIIDVQPDYFSGLRAEAKAIAALRGSYDLYNMTDGGGGVKGHRMSAESRAKMSAAKKGKPGPKPTAETRALLSRVQKMRVRGPVSAKARPNLLANAKKANEARRRAVLCVTDGKKYASVTDAAKAYGLVTATISNIASGRGRSRSGLAFRYLR